jgi:hypothetical protein
LIIINAKTTLYLPVSVRVGRQSRRVIHLCDSSAQRQETGREELTEPRISQYYRKIGSIQFSDSQSGVVGVESLGPSNGVRDVKVWCSAPRSPIPTPKKLATTLSNNHTQTTPPHQPQHPLHQPSVLLQLFPFSTPTRTKTSPFYFPKNSSSITLPRARTPSLSLDRARWRHRPRRLEPVKRRKETRKLRAS